MTQIKLPLRALVLGTAPLSAGELRLLLAAGLVRAVKRTADKSVTEYMLTHAGRVLLERAA